MLTTAQIEAYRDQGFIRGPKLLTDEETALLGSEIERVIADRDHADQSQPVSCRNLTGDPNNFVWQIVNIWQASDAFRDLLFNRGLGEMAAELTGARELRVWHDQVQYKPARKGGVNWWHQDSILWPPLTPKDQQITAWIALDDADTENGCMSMVSGSHRWGDQSAFLGQLQREHGLDRFLESIPTRFENQEAAVRHCPVGRGEVHFHHPLCWHGSQSNRSGRPRRAIAIHLMTEQTRFAADGGDHLMRPFIAVADGETILGEVFPLIYEAASSEAAV